MKKTWCIPPKQNAEFVARMEDVLEVYSKPYDPNKPVVCMDEKPFQLLDEKLKPIPMNDMNHVEKSDHEYERKGTCSIFMFTEPLAMWREAHALPQRTAKDWAHQMKWLIDEVYPDVEKIVLIADNLNTRDPEKFCVKANKYFQSDETQSMRKNLKGSIFYGKSIERNVERVCKQPAFYQYNGDHEQHERIVQ